MEDKPLRVDADTAVTCGRVKARRDAVESTAGSLAAEDLRPTPGSDRDAEAYVRGALSAEEMVARALTRRRPETRRAPG